MTVGVTVEDTDIEGVGVGVVELVGVGVGDSKNIGQVGVGVGMRTLPQASASVSAKAPIKETFLISKLQVNSLVEKLIPGNRIEGELSQLSAKSTS